MGGVCVGGGGGLNPSYACVDLTFCTLGIFSTFFSSADFLNLFAPRGAFCNTFDLHFIKLPLSLRSLFCLFLSGRFTQVLL